MARLTGTGLLADDLYLLAHHDVTGRRYLQPRALGLGLAGGLLAELTVAGNVCIWPDGVAAADRVPPQDGLARAVLDLVLAERQRWPTRDWLLCLARTATQDVARRLEQSGYLTRASARRPWRAEQWVPVDPDSAFAPLVRVRAALDPTRPPTEAGVALAGLATACGLGSRLLPYGPPGARHHLTEAVRHLAPDLRELITQTQAAVDSALLSHRV